MTTRNTFGDTAESDAVGRRGARPRRVHPMVEGFGALACVVAVVNSGTPLPIHIVAGLYLLVAAPMRLLLAKVRWLGRTRPHEALLFAFALDLAAIIVVGVVWNMIGPPIGIKRPLDTAPVAFVVIVAIIGLTLWRRDHVRWCPGPTRPTRRRYPLSNREQLLVGTAALCVVLAIAGAIRLNNGASGNVTAGMLTVAAAVLLGLIAWRDRIRENVLTATLYFLSLSMLLMTSLRGWYITGHDIQREFRVFQLVTNSGHWNTVAYRSEYNACLSITVLPAVVERMTGISDLYVFKVVFQALFALCPTLIYYIGRRFASRMIATLSAVYFIAFPTYFTDMPFLVRQEVAFFFLGVALLVMTNQRLSLTSRRIWFAVFASAVLLSHYSTMYILIGVLTLGAALTVAVRIAQFARRRRVAPPHQYRHHTVATWFIIVPLTLGTFLWYGPATGTGAQVVDTFISTWTSFATGVGQRSSDTDYSIFSFGRLSESQRLAKYAGEETDDTQTDRERGATYPLSEVDRYTMPVVPPAQLPPTRLGAIVGRSGISASTINRATRAGAADLIQMFVGLGLLSVIVGRARAVRYDREFLMASVGCVAVIGLQVLLPGISEDYGVLRTFEQGIFWFGPLIAYGSVQVFRWLGATWANRSAIALALVLYLSLTGVIPHALGGYPGQLNLNNSGQYYDSYYILPQEVTGIMWLQNRVQPVNTNSVQSEVDTDRYTFSRLQNYTELKASDDIYPVMVRRDAYIFLGNQTTQKGQVDVFYSGDLITYKYPVEFLDRNKNLIFDNGAVRIYR